MENPGDLKYTKEHEWVRVEGQTATIGITDFAQSELGEIVFVELPEVGRECEQGESICVAESTKAASDIYAPIGGKITEVNSALADAPNLVNSGPYGDGWLAKLESFDRAEVDSLMSAAEYQAYTQSKA